METQLAALKEQVKQLKDDIRVIKQHRRRAMLEEGKLRQVFLLGQIAYTMSELLEDFIFGQAGSGSMVPLSLKDYAHNTVPMTEDQQARWSSAQAFFAMHIPLQDLVASDEYLRWSFKEPGHGQSQPKDTSFAELHSWAGVHCSPNAVSLVQQYLRILNQFSTVNKPLAPSISMSAMIKS